MCGLQHNLFKPRFLINSIRLRLFSIKSGVFYSMDTEMSDANWRGVPLSEVIGSQSPWGAPEFPLVSPSHNHTVLYHIPANGDIGDRSPKPQIGQEKWDSDHVRMPCSSKSLYPVENNSGETHLKKRWSMIEEALKRPITDSEQLANAILSYNIKFRTIWKFRALHTLFNQHLDEEEAQYFFTVTLPEIAKLALSLPKLIQAPIPLLKQHKNHSISLTQLQIASLLANAFFCTFPRRNTSKRSSEYSAYPHINFSPLYECTGHDDVLEKLKCICHYFRRVCTKAPIGVATFTRRSVPPRSCPKWAESTSSIGALPVHVDPDGTIEDAHGLIQLDFANKYLGGGVLGHGCVQEEIRFVVSPELMVSMLFTEVLRPNEALFMIGCERYSKYEGYSRTFRWAGDHIDTAPLDSAGRRRIAVLAIDALPFANRAQEYRIPLVSRELNKAWVGFSAFTSSQPGLQYPGVATGNWGCGAFGGSPQLKALLQLMACAEARRPMAYYTFEDIDIRDEIVNVYNLLARFNVTVGELYKYIVEFSETDVRRAHLHAYIQQALHDRPSHPSTKQTSIAPQIIQNNLIQKAKNNSPDLFSSQDEDHSPPQIINDKQTVSDSTANKMADSDNKMAAHTTRLFEQMQKFDDENGQSNFRDSKNESSDLSHYFNAQKVEDVTSSQELKPNTVASSSEENKMADNTSRLFEAVQKIDDENGRLSFSLPHSSPFSKSINATHDSDVSMHSDRSEPSPEVKKKIARKITDYFSKKSTS